MYNCNEMSMRMCADYVSAETVLLWMVLFSLMYSAQQWPNSPVGWIKTYEISVQNIEMDVSCSLLTL